MVSSQNVDRSCWDFELDQWPVLIIRPKPEDMTLQQLEVALKHYDRTLEARREPYAVVFDSRNVKGMDASLRRRLAQYNAENEDRARAFCRGSAFVMTSTMVRGLMTAILWVRKPPVETRVFEELDEAMDWARLRVAHNALPESRTG